MAIFDQVIEAYEENRREQEARRQQAEVAEAKRLADKVALLLGTQLEPAGIRLTVEDEGHTVTFYFSRDDSHSGEKLIAEADCPRCGEKCAYEIGGPTDLGRLIVEGCHHAACAPRASDGHG